MIRVKHNKSDLLKVNDYVYIVTLRIEYPFDGKIVQLIILINENDFDVVWSVNNVTFNGARLVALMGGPTIHVFKEGNDIVVEVKEKSKEEVTNE